MLTPSSTLKKIEKYFSKIKQWCLRPLRNLLLCIAILPVVITTLLHIPAVQQQLLNKILNYLHKTTHYHIKCDAIRLTWLRHIALVGVAVTDPQNKPLLTIRVCNGTLNLLSVLLLKPDMIKAFSVAGAQLYLEENIEQDLNIATFYTKGILPLLPEANTDLFIKKMQLSGIDLYYHNPIKQQNITVENIHLGITNFLSSIHHHSGNITTLSYQETSDIPFALQNLITQCTITPHSIVLKDCYLMTKHSNLQGDFTMENTKKQSIFADKENIALEALLKETALSSMDLNKFSDFFKGRSTLYKLDGIVSLTPHSMVWKNCKLRFGPSDSYIQSTGRYNRIDRDADILVQTAMLHIHDLPPYLKQAVTVDLAQLKYIGLTNATFMGNNQKAKLMGYITTSIGDIQTDLTLHHLGQPIQDLTGKITFHKVAIDALLPSLPITSLSGEVAVKGQVGHLHTIDAVANLTEIQTNTYSYKEVEASCRMANATIAFKLHSKDPSAKLTLSGRYHMGSPKSLQADGIVEQIHLEKLGFVTTPLAFNTQFSLNLSNIFEKHPKGTIIFSRFKMQTLTQKIACQQIAIHSLQRGVKNLLTLTSPLIDCSLKGIFTMDDLGHHIKQLIKRLKNPVHQLTMPARFSVDYTIHCKKIAPILNGWASDLSTSPATTLLGHFAYDGDYHFSLHLPTPSTICSKQLSLEKTKINLNISHFTNNEKRLMQLSISSAKQDWYQKFQTDHLCCQLLIDKNKFTIANKLSSLKHHSNLSIVCSGTLMNDLLQIDLLPSSLTTKEKIWMIQTERTSLISKTEVEIGNLSITSGHEAIFIGGKLTKSTTADPLHCTIRHFALDYCSELGKLKGMMDGQLVAHFQKGHLTATAALSLKECTIQDYPVGTLTTKAGWNLQENKLTLEGMLQKADQPLLQMDGYCYLAKPSNRLGITATFNQMDLYLLNPLFASVCSEIEGKLSGKFQLTGSVSEPKLNGKGKIDKGQLKINYLNTRYQATGKIKVRENLLYVNQLHLYDGQTGHATLSGHMAIQNGFPLMLSSSMEAFHLLHTTQAHHPDFYGDLYATGSLQIEGPIHDVVLKMKATTNKGTFTIVADDKENIENTTKLVQFVYKKAKQPSDQPSIVAENKDRSAIKLMLDVTILPTVKTKVLFSSYNNVHDSLQGQGSGNIQLELGTNRKPCVMGNYLFQSGTYTVSVYNLIQKKFTIIPDSQVTFNGYLQEGMAHIKASYTQMASITELCPRSHDRRPVPVEIHLSAYGTLAHPHITYELFFPVKSIDFELNTALEECTSKALLDKNYLSKQILSLLIAKRVYNEKNIDGWEALSNSINDLLSQQIQNWASKIDHKLEIETDLGINQWKDKAINLLQKTKIKVSYLLLAEQLKLSSTFGRSSHLINDWEISYQISRDHNMSAKLYQQPLENASSKVGLFGIGFAYTKKFW